MFLIKSGQLFVVKLLPIASKGVGRAKSASSDSEVAVAVVLLFTVTVVAVLVGAVRVDACADVFVEALPVDIGGASSS